MSDADNARRGQRQVTAFLKTTLDFELDLGLLVRAIGSPPDDEAVKKVCQIFRSQLDENKDRTQKGEHALVRRGEVMPKTFMNYVAIQMLQSYVLTSKPVVLDLWMLFVVLTGYEDYGQNEARLPQHRLDAIVYRAGHPDAGVREIAKAVGVAPSTVSRWLHDDKHFNWFVERLRGNPKEIEARAAEIEARETSETTADSDIDTK